MKNIKFIIIIIVITVIRIGAREARAQNLALSISPPILEVMIKPGKSITQLYKITNAGEEPVVITPKLFELGTAGVKEDTEFVRDKWVSIISNDIDFDKPFILGNNKDAEFLLKINPTTSVAERDYYRALVFATSPNLPSDTTMSSFAQNMAVPILITVTSTGTPAKAAQIVKFDLPTIIDSFDVLISNIQIKNTGNAYFRPVGKITLTGPVGKGSYDLIPSALLTGETKQIMTTGQSSPNMELQSLYLPGFYIGKYQLTLDFSLDDSGIKMSTVKTFYAIPWKSATILILFILGIKLLKSLKLFTRGKK